MILLTSGYFFSNTQSIASFLPFDLILKREVLLIWRIGELRVRTYEFPSLICYWLAVTKAQFLISASFSFLIGQVSSNPHPRPMDCWVRLCVGVVVGVGSHISEKTERETGWEEVSWDGSGPEAQTPLSFPFCLSISCWVSFLRSWSFGMWLSLLILTSASI